jgi:hypothetical protein
MADSLDIPNEDLLVFLQQDNISITSITSNESQVSTEYQKVVRCWSTRRDYANVSEGIVRLSKLTE